MERGIFDGSAYNLASGIETTVSEMVTLLLKSLGYSGKIGFSGDVRLGDPVNWRADISRLASLGFVPEVTIQTGVQHYVQWLKEKGLR